MSVEGLQNSYLNYGFVDDTSVDGAERANTVGQNTVSDEAVKPNNSANRVRYFKRHQSHTEQTSLLQSHDDVNVAYFTKPRNEDYALRRFKKQHSCILVSDYLHKIVYICLIANFLLFARGYLDCNPSTSMISSLAVVVCCTLTSAALVLISDVLPRKLPFIFFGFITYIAGLPFLVWIADGGLKTTALRWCGVFALLLVCFGEAALRTMLPEFGLLPLPQGERKGKQFAWKMHWGFILAFITIACIITAVQQNVNFDVAFYISMAMIVVAFLVFMIPFKQYAGDQGSHSGTLRLVWNVFREAREVKQGWQSNESSSPIVEDNSIKQDDPPDHWIDFAITCNGGTYEESEVFAVKCLYDVTIVFLCLTPYWIAHAQCYTTYFFQGMHLDTAIGGVNVPIAWFSLFNMTVVMVLAPLFDAVVIPKLESWDFKFPVTWRMLSGLICCSISLLLAGGIEASGISYARSNRLFKAKIGNVDVTAVRLSIFVQIPQYFFLALSEVLTPLTALSIANRLCSGGFRRLAFGMYFVTIPLGHILALVIISLGWYPEYGYFMGMSVEIYFFALAALMLVNACLLAIVIYKMVDIPSRLAVE